MTSTSAWVRAVDNTYGAGKFPFGACDEPGCLEAACHRAPGNDNGQRLVCRKHLSQDIFFAPFLGQQEKLFMARERRVLGGGGAGGSKTYAGARLWLKQYHAEQERIDRGEIERSRGWALFLRRTIPELIQVIEDFKIYAHKVGKFRWDGDHNLAIFDNGYKVQFGGIKDDGDWLKFYGGEYTLLVFDEATTFTKKQIQELDGRLRCADDVLDRQVQLYLLTNPIGGETKRWLKQTFVNNGAETPVFEDVTLADGRVRREWRVYIPCNLYDNPALVASGRYEANLMTKGEAYRRAMLLNDWDVDEGTWCGDDWDPSVHICEPFAIPASWPRRKSCDYGYGRSAQTKTRTAVHWYATDPEGNDVCYRALSCRGLTAFELGHHIREIERRPLQAKVNGRLITVVDAEWDEDRDCSNVNGPMDASMWAAQGESHGESRGEIMDAIGCGFFRSDKGRDVRLQAAEHIRNRLRSRTPDARGSLTPGIPGLRYFRGTTETRMASPDGGTILTGPIHTIPTCPFDPANPDVWDTTADDHDLDTLAYHVSARPNAAEKPDEYEQTADVIPFGPVRAAAGGGRIDW